MPSQEEIDKEKYGWKKKNISFAKKEEQLKRDIVDVSEHIGFTKWMKLAAREKLERDGKKERDINCAPRKSESIINTPMNQPIQMKTNNSGIIDSLDDLFRK